MSHIWQLWKSLQRTFQLLNAALCDCGAIPDVIEPEDHAPDCVYRRTLEQGEEEPLR